MFSFSGLFSLVAVSWYASRVIHDFYDPVYGGVRCVTQAPPLSCVNSVSDCVCVCVHAPQVRTGNRAVCGLGCVHLSAAGRLAALLLLQEAGPSCPVGRCCSLSAGGGEHRCQIRAHFLSVVACEGLTSRLPLQTLFLQPERSRSKHLPGSLGGRCLQSLRLNRGGFSGR